MATQDFRETHSTNPVNAQYRMHELMQGALYSAHNLVLDSVTIDTSADNVAQNDVLQLVNVPAGSFVLAVGVNVATAEGATATMKLGDGDDDDAYGATVNLNSAVKSCSMPGALTEATPNTYNPAGSQGKFYASAGVIQGVANHALDAAVFTVAVLYVKLFG